MERSAVDDFYDHLLMVLEISDKELCAKRMCAVSAYQRVVVHSLSACGSGACGSLGVIRRFTSLLSL